MKQRIWAAIAAAAVTTSCAGLKPAARTTNDLVKDACAMFFSQQRGISFDDAAKTICVTREVLEPFYRHLLQAQRLAGAEAERGLARPDAGTAPDGGAP